MTRDTSTLRDDLHTLRAAVFAATMPAQPVAPAAFHQLVALAYELAAAVDALSDQVAALQRDAAAAAAHLPTSAPRTSAAARRTKREA
jgi:outer membrane murein-binding lipoprotein Lpp